MTKIEHSVGLEIECILPEKFKENKYKVYSYDSYAEYTNTTYIPTNEKRKQLNRSFRNLACLEDYYMGWDGSIEYDEDDKVVDLEAKFMFKQRHAQRAIKAICDRLKRFNCEVNDSCGLHVHLDSRHRKPEVLYQKLVKALPYMTKLVTKDRLSNDYCTINSFEPGEIEQERYMAVNYQAYSEHKTIEVRLHHGTIEYDEILPWVQLLIKIADAKEPEEEIEANLSTIKRIYRVNPNLERLLAAKQRRRYPNAAL